MSEASPSRRAADTAIDELAARFGAALRDGDAKAAESVAEAALAADLDVAAVHTRLIEPAMDWIGSLWEHHDLSVGEEHLATAICHGVAARIFPQALHARPRSRERVMLAAVEGEQHVMGLRLAADVLEGAGFDVLYLGADLPVPSLLEACRTHEPDVLGLTVAMQSCVPTLIWELDHISRLPRPPAVMAGGSAEVLAVVRDHGGEVAVVRSCEEVVSVVSRLLASPRPRASADRLPAMAKPAAGGPRAAAATLGRTPAGSADTQLPGAFAATSVAAADSVRDSARHAYAMERLAYRDGLTGLWNRRAFDDRFLLMSEHSRGEDQRNAMLMIDVDEFKTINDTYGHDVGDNVLVTVARAITRTLRPGDFAARFGGDEFVALLPATGEGDAVAIAERIRSAVRVAGSDRAATASIGVSVFSNSNRLTSLAADQALYQAKEAGRDRVVLGGSPQLLRPGVG